MHPVAEAELPPSLHWIEDAFAAALDAVVLFHWDGAEGRIRYANDALLRLGGFAGAGPVGHHWSVLLAPGADDSALVRMRAAFARGEPVRTEMRLRAAVVDLSVAPLPQPGLFLGIGRAVPRAAEGWDAERELLRAIIDTVPDLIYVKDLESRFVLANRATIEAMGASGIDELVGRTDFDFYPPELAAKYYADEQRVLRTGEPMIAVVEPQYRHSSVRRWLSTSKVPLRDATGRVVGLTGIGRDITLQREVEVALGASEARAARAEQMLVDAIESLADGFVLRDSQDRFVLCNSRYRELYPCVADLLVPGTPYREILGACARRGEVTVVGDVESWVEERLHPGRLGAPFEEVLSNGRWLRACDTRTKDGGIVGIRTDITEQMAARRQAQLANRAKSEFLANMSHELRTPLNAILGFSEVIRDQAYGPGATAKYLEYAADIHASGTLLLDLINDILDIAKIEAGKYELRRESIRVEPVVGSVLRLIEPRAERGRVRLSARFAEKDASLWADERATKQILLNLLSNAVKFTPPGGTVSVDVRPEGDRVVIRVCDTGIGMSEEDLNRIGKPFVRIESAINRRHDGTGIGLHITRSLVDLHGGRLSFESRPGEGTTVSVDLPATREAAEP